ncbi:hypothetical protein EYF80_015254 [Liparis tanakae]|uniref:Uncharacterized protein n=1 Tax=Liparis tanakae TaxID=230148 RepID=A0A4Z2IAY8_9TELE|nr:hypothetical protein EYF80_015254 [Liparis tanakae]
MSNLRWVHSEASDSPARVWTGGPRCEPEGPDVDQRAQVWIGGPRCGLEAEAHKSEKAED